MTKYRYIVKRLGNGDIGVYDTKRGSYPVQGPELRAVGVDKMPWLKGKDGMAEAVRVCGLLNGLSESAAKVADGMLDSDAIASPEVPDDLAALGAALVADQAS